MHQAVARKPAAAKPPTPSVKQTPSPQPAMPQRAFDLSVGKASQATIRRCACGTGGAGMCPACAEKQRIEEEKGGVVQPSRQHSGWSALATSAGRAVQPRLEVGPPDDHYEREADQVAGRVVSMSAPAAATATPATPSPAGPAVQTMPAAGRITPLVRRQPAPPDEDEEKTVQAKSAASPAPALQRLSVESAAPTALQRLPAQRIPGPAAPSFAPTEASRGTASTTARSPLALHSVQREPLESDEEEEARQVQTRSLLPGAPGPIQREAEKVEEEDVERKVRTSRGTASTPAVSPSVEGYISGLSGKGQPLSDSARSYFEPRFGHGFGGVRIHTDGPAQRSATALQAKAYTVGSDVVFGSGQYRPDSHEGRHLIAHELTHVVQQGAATPGGSAASTPPASDATAGAGSSDGGSGAASSAAGPSGSSGSAQRAQRSNLPASPPPAAALTTAPTPAHQAQRRHLSASRGATVQRTPAGTIQREPELKVGESYLIVTPQGGNLMLRVQPNAEKKLVGEATCNGPAECPNTVGNVRSGTVAKIKEVRSFGWYVVETKIESGDTRVGFVQTKYLQPVSAAPQAPPVPAADEAPDVEVPEEAEDAAIFEEGDAAMEAQEEGGKVEQFGIVGTDEGTNLWQDTERSLPKLGLLPLNTRLFVERKIGDWYSVYVEKHQRGEALPVASGTHGFIPVSRVSIDMPDPDAWLFRITKDGQGALSVAAEVYPNYKANCALGVAACRDHRYLVNVLVAVNEAKKRNYFVKDNPGDDWDKAKTKKATKQADGSYVGGQIWVPGMELVKALEGQVDSGSISLGILTTLADIAIGIAAFIVGLLHGAAMSVADIFIGVYDLIKLVIDLVTDLIKGNLISNAKAFWEDIQKISLDQILEMLGAKWNHPSTWERWKFRGYVIGYAIVEILLLIFSGGVVTAIKWAGKAGKFGKFAKYLSELPKIKKLITVAEGMKSKTVDKVKDALKAAHALSEAHGWAAAALKIPLAILRRLSEIDIAKLKSLPQWVKERFARLSDLRKLGLLCNSPCAVDVDKIVKEMKLVTKIGKALTTPDEVVAAIKAVDGTFKVAKISTKLRKKGSAVMALIKEAGITDSHLAHLVHFITVGDQANPAQAYRTFVRYLTSVVPAKVGPDIKELNRIAAAVVKAEVRRGSALKGAMFEQWVAVHIPQLASKTFGRISFDMKKLIKKKWPPFKRHVDKWVGGAAGEIWDMKHVLSKVPAGQADDYAKLLGKIAPDGATVKSINYLFPTKAAAELNKHLSKNAGFFVHYIDEVTNTMKLLP